MLQTIIKLLVGWWLVKKLFIDDELLAKIKTKIKHEFEDLCKI